MDVCTTKSQVASRNPPAVALAVASAVASVGASVAASVVAPAVASAVAAVALVSGHRGRSTQFTVTTLYVGCMLLGVWSMTHS